LLPPSEQPPPSASSSSSPPSSPPSTETAAAPTTAAGPGSTTTATTTAPRRLVTRDDLAGDAGLEAPPYADLVTITVDDIGSRMLVRIDMAGDVPAALAAGEVQGIGIDIYRSNERESDYQVFLDGGSDGWRAYLQTPDGFVDYPGTFAMGGRRLVVEVPWLAVGGREDGRLSTFCDWSAEATPLNRSSADRAPDLGTTSFAV
jgi:hypothetical protein